LQLKRKCWTQRQRRSTKVYPPAVPGGGRVMQTWQLERGQSPLNAPYPHFPWPNLEFECVLHQFNFNSYIDKARIKKERNLNPR
jgi:hypothetical protein